MVDAKNDLQVTEKEENKNVCDNQFCFWEIVKRISKSAVSKG